MQSNPENSPSPQANRCHLWYWRADNFRGLADLIPLLGDDPDLTDFVEYLRLRERGLRKDAFKHLGRFIAVARSWSLARRCEVVNRLMKLHDERPRVFDMIPTPLTRDLIDPTLDEWMVHEPTNPVPFRWRGGTDNLRRAIALDPRETIARAKLIKRLLDEVAYATHELPSGYIGSAQDDIKTLDEVASLLTGSSLEETVVRSFGERLSGLRRVVQSYVSFLKSGSDKAYVDWISA